MFCLHASAHEKVNLASCNLPCSDGFVSADRTARLVLIPGQEQTELQTQAPVNDRCVDLQVDATGGADWMHAWLIAV